MRCVDLRHGAPLSAATRVHMQETPSQYIMWRFAGNDDKKNIVFKCVELSVDEVCWYPA